MSVVEVPARTCLESPRAVERERVGQDCPEFERQETFHEGQ